MITSPNISDYHSSQSPVLVGVIVDVSSSMRRNWRNRNGKQLPRIEVIRDTLNKWIREEQQLRKIQADNIKIFCLGMGFKAPMYWTDVDCSDEQEHPLGNAAQKRIAVHLTCDLLALSEILPSKEKLTEFKEKLNQKWVEYTKEILEKSVITEDLYTDLVEYVQDALYKTATQHLHQSLLYRLFYQFNDLFRRVESVYQFLRETIIKKEENITTLAKRAGADYVGSIFTKTRQDFTKNTNYYASIIYHHLNSFARTYAHLVLRALTLGFETIEMVDDLDKEKVMAIARQIYTKLEIEVRKHIIRTVVLHERQLLSLKRNISASIRKKELRFFVKYPEN